MVITSALHAEGRRFEPGWKQGVDFFYVFQIQKLKGFKKLYFHWPHGMALFKVLWECKKLTVGCRPRKTSYFITEIFANFESDLGKGVAKACKNCSFHFMDSSLFMFTLLLTLMVGKFKSSHFLPITTISFQFVPSAKTGVPMESLINKRKAKF